MNQNRSFMITLSIAVVSGVAIGLMAFGSGHPGTPQPVGPVANAPAPSSADVPSPDTGLEPVAATDSNTGGTVTSQPSTDVVPADVPATSNDPGLPVPR